MGALTENGPNAAPSTLEIEVVARAITLAETQRRFKWTPTEESLAEMIPAHRPAAIAAIMAFRALTDGAAPDPSKGQE